MHSGPLVDFVDGDLLDPMGMGILLLPPLKGYLWVLPIDGESHDHLCGALGAF